MRFPTPVAALLLISSLAQAQTFDVISIKPDQTGSENRQAGSSPGGVFTATNVSLKLLIARAFGVAEFQVARGPGWMETEKYDISARADTPKDLSREELRPYLQDMLAQRFHLKFHREMKEGSAYALVSAKNGPKLTEHTGGGLPAMGVSIGSGKADITGVKETMAKLAEYLAGQVGRPTIDRTGLTQEYDFRVEWVPEQTGGSAEASIFTALQEQLGLKLDSVRAPVETIVVDSAEKASAN